MNEKEYEDYICRLKDKIDEQRRTIQGLNKELKKEQDVRRSYEFRIETELEPRIRREKASYDAWVTTDKAAEASEHFGDKVDDLIEMVEENPDYFIWESSSGDIYEMILCLIRFHILDDLENYCIVDKE